MVLRKDDENKISCIYNTELKCNKENQKAGKYSNEMGSVWNNRRMENWIAEYKKKKSIHDYDEVPGKEMIY